MTMSVTLAEANGIAGAALARGVELACAPLTVVVLDAGGHPVVVQRQDRSGILRVEIATAKAYGSLGMRLPTRNLMARAEHMPRFFDALAVAADGRMIPVAGGVLIRRDDDVVGAVGVSGDTSDRDEECAVAGIAAMGLTADTESTEPW